MKQKIKKLIEDSLEVKKKMLEKNIDGIEKAAEMIIEAYEKNRKVVIFGNGGSAADAVHFAAELVCRFEKERRSLDAVALPANSSLLTAIGNDYGFERVFSRQVESIVREGDAVIGISTSGNSKNVILAIKKAKEKKAVTIGFAGEKGGELKKNTDCCICIPSNITARVQEGHELAIHIICNLVESELF